MNGSAVETPRAVIVISSHVARGSVGNRAAVFALETLGHPVWAVPTVILPWHPGHGPATRIVPDADQFSAFMKDLERAPWLGEVAAVLSGYLGDAAPGGRRRSAGAAGEGEKPERALCLRSGDGRRRRALRSRSRRPRPCATFCCRSPTSPRPTATSSNGSCGAKLDDLRSTIAAALDARPAAHAGHLGAGDDGRRHRQSAGHADRGAARRAPPDRQAAQRARRPDGRRVPGAAAGRPARRQGAADRPRRRSTRSSPARPSAAATSCSSKPMRRACRIRWRWCSSAISPIPARTGGRRHAVGHGRRRRRLPRRLDRGLAA